MDDPRQPTRGTKVVVFGRVVLLVVAAATVTLLAARQVRYNRGHGPEGHVTYACPMHGDVTATASGTCPICGMELERRVEAKDDTRTISATSSDGQTVVLAGGWTVPHHYSIEGVRRVRLSAEIRAPALSEDRDNVSALMYRDEAAVLVPDERVVFVEQPPGFLTSNLTLVSGSVVEPDDHAGATVRVRFRVTQGQNTIPRGTTGEIVIEARNRDVLAIPPDGIIESPEGPYVLIAEENQQAFTKRRVHLGRSYPAFVIVVGGLGANEPVAIMGAFFIDTERRLRAARASRRTDASRPEP